MLFNKDKKINPIGDAWYRFIFFGKIIGHLAISTEKNPVILAEEVFELKGFRMHGPHYHSIVPAIIVTAFQNAKGAREMDKIKAAIKRGADFKGGSCGNYGVCGAAAGAGIASSVIEGASPISIEERGNAQAAAGQALLELSKFGGPRCCQRESFTTIFSFIKNTDYFNEIEIAEHKCKQFPKNRFCLMTIFGTFGFGVLAHVENVIFMNFLKFAVIWFGLILYLLCFLACFEIIQCFIKVNRKYAGISIIALSILIVIYGIWNARDYEVHQLEIPIDRLTNEVRIFHIPDLHLGPFRGKGTLQNIIRGSNPCQTNPLKE